MTEIVCVFLDLYAHSRVPLHMSRNKEEEATGRRGQVLDLVLVNQRGFWKGGDKRLLQDLARVLRGNHEQRREHVNV